MGRRIGTALATIGLGVAAAAALASPAAATTSAADPYCTATFTVFSQWSNGYVAGFGVRNTSTVPVRWRLVLTFPGPILSMQVWNATYTQTGSTATIVPSPPGGVLQPGQSVLAGDYLATGPVVPPQAEVTCTPLN